MIIWLVVAFTAGVLITLAVGLVLLVKLLIGVWR